MIKANQEIYKQLLSIGDFNASKCFSCGSCTALCPVGLDILPRTLFRYAILGAGDKIIEESDAIFSCLLCRLCEEMCPEGVNIAENIRMLRQYIAEREYNL